MVFLLYGVVGVALAVFFMYFLMYMVALATGHDDIERNSTTVMVAGSVTAVLRAAEETLKKNGFSYITHNPESGVLIGSYRIFRIAPLRFAVRDRGDGWCELTVSGRYRRAVENVANLVPVEYARLNPTLPTSHVGGAAAQPQVLGPAPDSVRAPVAPAGWLADPTGRHQLRYWDSAQWTEHVSNDGVPAVDAI